MLYVRWTLAQGRKIIFASLLALALTSCFSASIQWAGNSKSSVTASNGSGKGYNGTITVLPLFPAHPYWTDYISNPGNSSVQYVTQNGICSGSELNCVHSAERQLVTTSYSSCSGLSMKDNLGAFDWYCDDMGGSANFYSSGFHPGMGLGNLINSTGTGFLSNYVTLFSNGSSVVQSTPSSWWKLDSTQTMIANPSSSASLANLNTPYRIYVLTANAMGSYGFSIGASHVSLVALPGVGIFPTASTTSFCNSVTTCSVSVNTQPYAWIEGNFDSTGIAVQYGINGYNSNYLRINNTTVRAYSANGIFLTNGNGPTITSSVSASNGNNGFQLASPAGLYVRGVRAVNNSSMGFSLNGATSPSIIRSVSSDNNGTYGIQISNSPVTTLASFISTNNGQDGLNIVGTTMNSTFHQGTLASNGNNGANVSSCSNCTFSQILAYGQTVAAFYGLSIQATSSNFYQVVAANNNYGLYNSSSLTHFFHTSLGSNTTDFTGSNGAETTTGVSFPPSGLIGNTEPDFYAGNTTIATYASAYGYNFSVSNNYRSWGLTSTPGQCTSGNCAIWDWRLASARSPALGTPLTQTGGSCATSVDPGAINNVVTDQQTAANTYIVGALSIDYSQSRPNPLCTNSQRTCVYSPNVGIDQGEGTSHNYSCNFNLSGSGFANTLLYGFDSASGS